MKKLGVICLVFLVALSIMGAAHAAWTQNLSVTGTVNTGTFIVTVAQDPAATAINDSGPVGLSGTAIVTIGTVTGTGANAGFSVTITNGYPGLIVKVPYKIAQTGSVPAKVTAMKLGILGASPITWDGTVKPITLNGGSYTDVKLYNTSDGNTLHISNLINTVLPANTPMSSATIQNVLVIEIPDALTGVQDAGGLNSGLSQTFNFEIDTQQAQ
jgi:uncharacterized membrane protein